MVFADIFEKKIFLSVGGFSCWWSQSFFTTLIFFFIEGLFLKQDWTKSPFFGDCLASDGGWMNDSSILHFRQQ